MDPGSENKLQPPFGTSLRSRPSQIMNSTISLLRAKDLWSNLPWFPTCHQLHIHSLTPAPSFQSSRNDTDQQLDIMLKLGSQYRVGWSGTGCLQTLPLWCRRWAGDKALRYHLSWPHDLGKCTWLLQATSLDAKIANNIPQFKEVVLNLRFMHKSVWVLNHKICHFTSQRSNSGHFMWFMKISGKQQSEHCGSGGCIFLTWDPWFISTCFSSKLQGDANYCYDLNKCRKGPCVKGFVPSW